MTKKNLSVAGALAFGLIAAQAAPAFAQDPAAAPEEPKLRLDLGLVLALPQGDYNSEGSTVDMSPGARIAVAYTVATNISVSAALRYILIQADGDSTDLTHYDLSLGGRYTIPINDQLRAYGEAELYYTTISFDDGETSDSESGVGFGAGGGIIYKLGDKLGLFGALRFTTASIEFSGGGFTFTFDAAWLTIDAGAALYF